MAIVESALMTAEAFFAWTAQDEQSGRFFELDRGEVVELPPPGKFHGFVCTNIAAILRTYAIQSGRGYVCGNDSGVIVERNPDTVRGPDVSFFDDEQTAETMDRAYAEHPPVLAVEVLSPTDRFSRTMRRVAQLLKSGVKLVWVVDLETQEVSICRPEADVEILDNKSELTGNGVLPEFRCQVSEFFRYPGRR